VTTGRPVLPRATATRPTTVGEVMTTGVVVAHAGAQFKHIVESLARNRISCAPVVDDERRVLGVVTESDLLAHLAGTRRAPRARLFRLGRLQLATARPVTAAELMSAPVVAVHPDDSLVAAAHRALAANVHRMPVVDTAGHLVGIVSRADLLRAYLRPDAEIAGEIERDVLAGRLALEPGAVRVGVQAGVVRLSGHVDWPAIGDQLLAEVRAVPGVVSVRNELSR